MQTMVTNDYEIFFPNNFEKLLEKCYHYCKEQCDSEWVKITNKTLEASSPTLMSKSA